MGRASMARPSTGPASTAKAKSSSCRSIPIVGKVLGGLLGGLQSKESSGSRCTPASTARASPMRPKPVRPRSNSWTRSSTKVLGREAEYGGSAMPPAQEAQFAAQLLEVSNEEEMERVSQPHREHDRPGGAGHQRRGQLAAGPGADRCGQAAGPSRPSGRRRGHRQRGCARYRNAMGRTLGSAASSLFEMESDGDERGGAAVRGGAPRRAPGLGCRPGRGDSTTRCTAAAGRRALGVPRRPTPCAGRCSAAPSAPSRRSRGASTDGATAATGAPAATARYGGYPRYGGYRRYGRVARSSPLLGRIPPIRLPTRVAGAPRPAPDGTRTGAGAEPPPPPPQPGYRWVAVPIGAPPPVAEPPAGAGSGAAARTGPPPPGGGGRPTQSEFGRLRLRTWRYGGGTGPSGRWIRRAGKIIVLDV